MKKIYLLVFLLAIVSIATAQFSMNVKRTMEVPFPKSKTVVTLLALNDGFIAFGDSCEAIKMYYDSTRVDTIDYARDQWVPCLAKAAHKAKEGQLFVTGTHELISMSEDNGRTWGRIYPSFRDSFGLIIETEKDLRFVAYNDFGIVFLKVYYNVLPTRSKLRETDTEIINLIAGFDINKTPIFVKTTSDNGSVKSSLIATLKDRINDARGQQRTETLTMNGDSVIAAIKDASIKDNETIKMIAINATGNYLITTGIDNVIKKEPTPIYLGDKLLPYGYNFPDGNSLFFGNDKDGLLFTLSAENKRNNTNISFKVNCLSGTGDTLLLGGINRQVIILEKVITSLNQTKEGGATVFFANNSLNIKAADKEKVTVVNLSGQIIFSTSLNGEELQIDATRWSRGMYLVKTGYKTTKVVK